MNRAMWLLAPAMLIAQPASARDADTKAEEAQEIAEDAARDLKDSRFYNKPGIRRQVCQSAS